MGKLDYPTILQIPQLIGREICLLVTPIPKPRMTRRDKWAQRPCVMRYRAFKDELRDSLENIPFPTDVLIVLFGIPMPKSWSKKKKNEMWSRPHAAKPDIDNLLKALIDAVMIEDQSIHTVFAQKVWSEEGYIRFIAYP